MIMIITMEEASYNQSLKIYNNLSKEKKDPSSPYDPILHILHK